MSTRWYCDLSGVVYGPMTGHDLKRMAERGKLGPKDHVRKGEGGKWAPAVAVRGLVFPSPPVAVPRRPVEGMAPVPRATRRLGAGLVSGALALVAVFGVSLWLSGAWGDRAEANTRGQGKTPSGPLANRPESSPLRPEVAPARTWVAPDSQSGVEKSPFRPEVTPASPVVSGQRHLPETPPRSTPEEPEFPVGEVACFAGHTDVVLKVAFARDGLSILSGSKDNTARVWGARNRQAVGGFQGYEPSWADGLDFRWLRQLKCVGFSPDGSLAVFGGDDETVRICEVKQGRELRRITSGLGFVTAVAFSPDGRTLLTGHETLLPHFGDNGRIVGATSLGGRDDTLRLWDAFSGQEIRRFKFESDVRGRDREIRRAVFSPDGRYVLSSHLEGKLRLWDVTRDSCLRVFDASPALVLGLALSPDCSQILIGDADGGVRLLDQATGREIRSFEGHQGRVFGVAFSLDGSRILTGGAGQVKDGEIVKSDCTVRLWDVASGQQLHRFDGHTDGVYSVAFSPGGRCAVSGSADGTVRLWGLPR
jgi:WD40 repeat protein